MTITISEYGTRLESLNDIIDALEILKSTAAGIAESLEEIDIEEDIEDIKETLDDALEDIDNAIDSIGDVVDRLEEMEGW